MIEHTNHTAILVFSRTPSAEARHKRLQQLDGHNVKLHGSLQRLVFNAVKKSDLPVVSITEEQQVGDTFGERISNAFRELFYKGYYNVIAIGTDCPDLSFSEIKVAHNELLKGNATIGPDQRGGAYLIAMNRDMFKSDMFEHLVWQTDHLASDLELYFNSQKVTCDKLTLKLDLNHYHDVLKAADTCKQVKSLLKSFGAVPNTYINQVLTSEHSPQQLRRGPPQR